MFKVTFRYKQDSPSGGNTNSSGWTEEIRVLGAENANELQQQIDEFKADTKNGYRKYIKVINIERL